MTKLKGIAFIDLDGKSFPKRQYNLEDLRDKLVFDVSKRPIRPVLLKGEWLWAKGVVTTNRDVQVTYYEGYTLTPQGQRFRYESFGEGAYAESKGIVQPLDRLEEIAKDYGMNL